MTQSYCPDAPVSNFYCISPIIKHDKFQLLYSMCRCISSKELLLHLSLSLSFSLSRSLSLLLALSLSLYRPIFLSLPLPISRSLYLSVWLNIWYVTLPHCTLSAGHLHWSSMLLTSCLEIKTTRLSDIWTHLHSLTKGLFYNEKWLFRIEWEGIVL